ncbi:MAG: Fe(3+) ABC transporter substrate-binding protein [Rickettsiales bacterium]|nr:Fe(3+) ABC transporter substrate-binding protein [Rickettsiales bacterium]
MIKKALFVTAVLLVGLNVYLYMGNSQLLQRNTEQAAKEDKDAVVNVYSSRKEFLIRDVLDQFSQDTGIKVNLITDKAGKLIARMEQEGSLSPADVLITTDVGNLYLAKTKNLLQPVRSDALEASIPSYLRDDESQWFGLTKRVRAIFYAKDRVNPLEIESYENLADEKWKGRLLIRSSGNVYNQSLVAAQIATHGEEATEAWIRAIVGNFARNPEGGDTDQIRSVAAGVGDIAVANSYYYGRLMASDVAKDQEVVSKVGIYFPNQDKQGVHVNITGIGMAANAPNQRNATLLMEYLVTEPAQKIFAEANHESAILADVSDSEVVQSWGAFKEDSLALSDIAKHNVDALKISDKAGWK